MDSSQVDRIMTRRYTGWAARRWAAAALIFCLMVPGAFAQEKLKSVWVKADELLTQKQYEEAVKLYSIAIEMNLDDPDIYNAYFHRAQAFLELDKVAEALADYTKTIRLNPSFPNAYRYRGIIYFETGRYTDAVNDFSRFIELEPDKTFGYVNRGSALGKIGNYDKALADFNTSIQLDPTCAECYYYRFMVFTALERDSEAELDLKKAQSLDSRYKGDK